MLIIMVLDEVITKIINIQSNTHKVKISTNAKKFHNEKWWRGLQK